MASFSGDYSTSQETHNGVEYTRVTCHSGRTLVELDNGDVFENYLFDQTGGGYAALMSQTSWRGTPPATYTVRNVGFLGSWPSSADGGAVIFSCTDEATVENLYLGDGHGADPQSSNWHSYAGAMRASPEHSGHLNIRRWYVSNWIDNALYASPPASPGPGGGTFTIEDCYVVDSSISCYRSGTDTLIRNCYGRTRSNDHRVAWLYEGGGHLTIEDCSFDAASSDRAIEISSSSGTDTTASVENSYFTGPSLSSSSRLEDRGGNTQTSSPPHFVPEGCPTSALEAATGEGGGDGSPAPLPGSYDFINPPSHDHTNISLYRNEEPDGSSTGETMAYHHKTTAEQGGSAVDPEAAFWDEWADADPNLGDYVIWDEDDGTHIYGEIPPGEEHRHAFSYGWTQAIWTNGVGAVQFANDFIDPSNYDNPDAEPPDFDDPDDESLTLSVDAPSSIEEGEKFLMSIEVQNVGNSTAQVDIDVDFD